MNQRGHVERHVESGESKGSLHYGSHGIKGAEEFKWILLPIVKGTLRITLKKES